ncbi:MAG: 5'-3' exonuclease H3TH domain-containing protein [Gemmatimonadaceae bacterium]
MRLHLVDGTFELFRAHFGAPSALASDGREVGATRALLRSLLALLKEPGVTHVGVAFDHVIESFRNRLFPGYKTGEGLPPELVAQFPLAESATRALGLVTWPMVEFEADDAIATAAARWGDAPGVEQVVICSPDKDLMQCVRGVRVVSLDRIRRKVTDEPGVVEKFGIPPGSIPDFLALVGDSADGIPGVPRWGAKSAAAVLAHYRTLDDIPDAEGAWGVTVRGAAALAEQLRTHRAEARLYRTLATLRTDVPLAESLDDLQWRGADRAALTAFCSSIGDERFVERVPTYR